ncbi:MAG: MFS transporter, partial [Clostridia bacterium]|nr:MFS transporter [Clostridia bacterium]
AMYLSLALLADIIDHHEAKHGFRTDGLSMTIYGAIMAGMTGVATGILNAVLGAFNFTEMASAGAGTEAFKWAMTFLFLGGETVCYAIIAVMFMFMKVEKFSKFDHIAIAADQKALAEKEGRVYVDPHLKMMLDEAEYVLKAKCEAENLNFDQEWAGKKAEVTEKYQAEKAKKEEKEAKRSNPAKDAETLKEFNEIRVKSGRPPISM